MIPAGRASSEICTVMDFLPTFVHLAGGECPVDRVIDGKDIWSLLRCEQGARPPHDVFYYYHGHQLQALRSGKWKLHLQHSMLVNLDQDLGETNNLIDDHTEVAERLADLAEKARVNLGDGEPGNFGSFDGPVAKITRPGLNIRPCGYVDDPQPLVL